MSWMRFQVGDFYRPPDESEGSWSWWEEYIPSELISSVQTCSFGPDVCLMLVMRFGMPERMVYVKDSLPNLLWRLDLASRDVGGTPGRRV